MRRASSWWPGCAPLSRRCASSICPCRCWRPTRPPTSRCRWASIRNSALDWPRGTSCHSDTNGSSTCADRRVGSTPMTAPAAGARSFVRAGRPGARSTVIGHRDRATKPAERSPATIRRPQCSSRTTRWRLASSWRCTRQGARCPTTSASSGSTTCRRPGFYIPPLTTVRQDFAELGRMSVEHLLAAIEGRDVQRTTIAPQLVERASTAPPAH